MSKIKIKLMSEDAFNHLNKNIAIITRDIQKNDTNDWIYKEFPQPIFIEKNFEIEDFNLINNPESMDKDIDYKNSISMYESLNVLPRYVLTDQKFWLWLHFEKFYYVAKNIMKVNSESTIKDHWTHKQGVRRGLFFGALSRCYFRVALTIDENREDKYELTKWVIENPERFRNLTWRSYSSELHIVRGALKGEYKAVKEAGKEINDIYDDIGKYVSKIGSVRLLDIITEEDMENYVYKETLKLIKEYK